MLPLGEWSYLLDDLYVLDWDVTIPVVLIVEGYAHEGTEGFYLEYDFQDGAHRAFRHERRHRCLHPMHADHRIRLRRLRVPRAALCERLRQPYAGGTSALVSSFPTGVCKPTS